MKFLTHTIMLLIGFLLLPVVIGIIEYNQPQSVTMKHKQSGKVLATTRTHNLFKCSKVGFTLIRLDLSKEIVVLCGVHKGPGEKISVTVDGPSKFNI
jgi:hypothetical protein